MSLHKKIKVIDFETLQLEKQRLKAVCDIKKVKMERDIEHLKKIYPEVVTKVLLPFDDKTNDRIFNGVKWVHKAISSYVDNNDSKLAKFFSGRGANMLHAVIIYTVIRIARNALFHKK